MTAVLFVLRRPAARRGVGSVLLELTAAEQRVNAVMEVLRDGLTVTEVADRYGVSRQAVHSWLGRYRSGGLDALADRSHRPNSCPHQMPAAVEACLCELRRRHPGWGQRRLAHELARDGVDPPPGLTSIYRALVRNGLIQPRPRRRPKADYRRWERPRPMELWQLDIMGAVFAAAVDHERGQVRQAAADGPLGDGGQLVGTRCSSASGDR